MGVLRNAKPVIIFVASWNALACDHDKQAPFAPDVADGINTPYISSDPCAHPNTGCACTGEGDVVDCGKVVSQHGDYVTCSTGTRTCTDGVWGDCQGSQVTSEESAAPSPGLHMLALGSSQVCGTDLCDPYCNRIVDSPSGYDPGQNGFTSGVQGLTLTRTAGSVPCTSLTLTPSTTSLKVTSLTSPFVSGGNTVTFTLTASPSGCATSPFTTTWAVDKVDRAAIAGTTDTNGVLTLAVPTAGTLRVTAFAQALSTYVDIPVKLDILSTAPAAPNSAATSAQINAFSSAGVALAGTLTSTATWLYPYASTYFPLGLTAPALQYSFTSAPTSAQAAKVTLRYPSGKALNDSSIVFNYSMIVKESNAVSAAAGVAANYLYPQVVIPQSVWSAFEQSARGNDADIIVQRYTGTLEKEKAQKIHFVDGQLKGTVYYNSYNSTIGGSTSTNVFGAVLKIKPKDTVPTQAVPYVSSGKNGLQTNGVCTVCHTVSANGSTLTFESGYTNGAGCYGSSASGGNYRGNSCSFSLSSSGTPTWISTLALGGSNQYRFNFGAPYPDGSFYLTNAWDNTESFGSTSALAQVSNGNTLASTGTPPLAITPAFSSDGRTVAYNDGTDGLVVIAEMSPCRNSSGSTTTYKEFAVIRNDSPATVDISNWTIQRSNGTTCFTVGNNVSLAAGAIATVQDTSDCLSDTSDTLSLYDSDGNLRDTSTTYSTSGSSCGTAAGKYGSRLSCSGTWSNKTLAKQESVACSVTSSTDMSTNKLKAKSFSCGAASGSTTCGSGTKTFSDERTVADCASTGCVTAGNPSFLPDGRGLVYQHVTTAPATSAAYGGSVAVSRLNTWQGAQAEVWFTNSVQSPSYAPRRLNALNGYNSSGTNYLPLRPRAFSTAPTGYSWSFHDSSAGSSGWVYDKCGGSSPLITATVNEDKLNYIPTVAPQEAGGKYWVIFTSRRLYGSVATSSPWQAERSNDSSNYFGPFTAASCNSYDQYSPGSGLIETKKLWIAAVDKDWETSGTSDPSHPAFYLPGQELKAGNSHGYWVANACASLGASCDTNDDCCDGTGTNASAQCKITSTSSVPATKVCSEIGSCSSSGESCDTSDDCCTGLTCPTGGGVCISTPPLAYHQQSLSREYDSACADGFEPTWRFLEWQATVPTGTSIAFSVQAKRNATDAWSPSSPAAMSTATTTTPSGQWDPDITLTSTVGDILAAASPALEHASYVRVTMTFNPDSTGTSTPTLLNWRQVYDCMPAN